MRRFISYLLDMLIFGSVDATDIFWDNTPGKRLFSFGDSDNWNLAPVPFSADSFIFLLLAGTSILVAVSSEVVVAGHQFAYGYRRIGTKNA